MNKRPGLQGEVLNFANCLHSLISSVSCMVEMLSFINNASLLQAGPPLEAQWEPALQKSHGVNKDPD